jgi:hypothetical protein
MIFFMFTGQLVSIQCTEDIILRLLASLLVKVSWNVHHRRTRQGGGGGGGGGGGAGDGVRHNANRHRK